jgi:hypothetical protein
MRSVRVAGLLLAVVVTAASCDGSQGSRGDAPRGLAGLALRPGEAPQGSVLDQEAGGPIDSLREVLPPRTDAPELPPLAKTVRRAFLGGHDVVYRGQGGLTEVTSSVLRFADAANAGGFLAYLKDAQAKAISVGASEILETPGLGEEGYGWHRTVPGAETAGCTWRRGELVFTLTLAGGLGDAPAQRAVDLATRVDQRL